MRISLQRQLQALALVQLPARETADHLADVLSRFGPTREMTVDGWEAVREYLVPLQSMPTRYVVTAMDGWSLLLSNMRLEARHVEALAISQRSGCLAVSAHLMADSRQMGLIRAGKEVRDIACYKDGPKWFFAAKGEVQPWEATGSYAARRVSDRFTPEQAAMYVAQITDVRFPLVWKDVVRRAFCIERSTKDVRVPLTTFEVERDV